LLINFAEVLKFFALSDTKKRGRPLRPTMRRKANKNCSAQQSATSNLEADVNGHFNLVSPFSVKGFTEILVYDASSSSIVVGKGVSLVPALDATLFLNVLVIFVVVYYLANFG
jgi:hypothetical protein